LESIERVAFQLVDLGYKVGIVRQVPIENDRQRTDREERVLELVMTPGTRDAVLSDSPSSISSPESCYLLVLEEDKNDSPLQANFAIVLLESSIGEFSLSRFKDDRFRSNLETLILQVKPREIVFQKSRMSANSIQVIRRVLCGNRITFSPLVTCYSDQKREDEEIEEFLKKFGGRRIFSCIRRFCLLFEKIYRVSLLSIAVIHL